MAHEVVEVEPGQAEAVGDAIADGFHDNEIWVWLIPGLRRRMWVMRRAYRGAISHVGARAAGSAWTTPAVHGGCLWIPAGEPRRRPLEELRENLAMAPGLGPRASVRGLWIEAMMQRNHPSEPHWYLEVLSIAPEHQGKGYGSALIQPGLERADAAGVGCYLETQRESNLPFYRRFGFELTDEVTTHDSPPLWLMWRPPSPSVPR